MTQVRQWSIVSLEGAIAGRDNGFNLVRLIAALLVVFFHSYRLNTVSPNALDPVSAYLSPVTDLGSVAVGVFFLISGIFIAQSWVNDPNILRFAIRRVARIVPGLFVCSLATVVVASAFFSTIGLAALLQGETWRYVLGSSMLHWLVYDIPGNELRVQGLLLGQDLNGPLWTLYWEGRMYVMVALLGSAAILPTRLWFGGSAVFLLLAANLFPSVLSGYVWEVRMWSMFLTGMLLQTLAAQVRIGIAPVICAVALAAMNWTRNVALTESGFTFFGIALMCGAFALWLGTRVRPQTRPLQHVSVHDYSYAIYIYHWPVMLALRAWVPSIGPVELLAATVAVLIPVSMASWHCVEAPVLGWVRRYLSKSRT